MGLFDSFGINADDTEVPTYEKVKPGAYPGVVKSDEIVRGSKNDDDYLGLKFTYELEGIPFLITEQFSLPRSPESEWDNTNPLRNSKGEVVTRRNGDIVTEYSQNKYYMGLIKGRLLGIGVPADRLNTYDPDTASVAGFEVVVTIVDNNGYSNVKRGEDGVKPRRTSVASLPQAVSPVAASKPAQGFSPAWGGSK